MTTIIIIIFYTIMRRCIDYHNYCVCACVYICVCVCVRARMCVCVCIGSLEGVCVTSETSNG